MCLLGIFEIIFILLHTMNIFLLLFSFTSLIMLYLEDFIEQQVIKINHIIKYYYNGRLPSKKTNDNI